MRNFIIFIAASIGGAIGWWLGARVGIYSALFLSLVGTAVAVYYSRRWVREMLG